MHTQWTGPHGGGIRTWENQPAIEYYLTVIDKYYVEKLAQYILITGTGSPPPTAAAAGGSNMYGTPTVLHYSIFQIVCCTYQEHVKCDIAVVSFVLF